MGVCEQCTSFRRLRPASQLLATAFSTTDAAVSGALTKIVEDEGKQRESEAEYKRAQASAGLDQWAAKPVMSDFCGFREAEGVFLIAEVKNQGGGCTDFAAGRPERHACADCRHRVPGPGPAADLAMEQQYASMAVASISAGVQASQPDSLLTKYREGVASRKGFELAGAYAAKGVMAGAPLYLDQCAKYSTEDEYVVCILRNPHHTCAGWEAGAAHALSAAQPSASPQPALLQAPAPPPQAAPAPQAPAGPALAAPPLAPPMTAPDEVLVAGSPPLTNALVDRAAAYFEWILDVKLGLAHRAIIRQSLVDDWTKGNAETITGMQNMDANFTMVEASDAATRALFRETNQAAFVQGLRAEGSEQARAILEVYDEANKPLAPGDPPLTREMAESFLEMLAFVLGEVQGAPGPLQITDQMRTAWIDQLVIEFPKAPPEQRAWIVGSPLAWVTIKAVWPTTAPADRDNLRNQWRQELGPALAGMAAASQAASGPASYSPAPVAPSPATAEKSSVELLTEIEESGRQEEEELMKTNPQLAIQKKMQREAQYAQMMSNMMTMSHQTSMAIINNMKV